MHSNKIIINIMISGWQPALTVLTTEDNLYAEKLKSNQENMSSTQQSSKVPSMIFFNAALIRDTSETVKFCRIMEETRKYQSSCMQAIL